MPYCSACGEQLPSDSKFCGSCGRPTEGGESSPESRSGASRFRIVTAVLVLVAVIAIPAWWLTTQRSMSEEGHRIAAIELLREVGEPFTVFFQEGELADIMVEIGRVESSIAAAQQLRPPRNSVQLHEDLLTASTEAIEWVPLYFALINEDTAEEGLERFEERYGPYPGDGADGEAWMLDPYGQAVRELVRVMDALEIGYEEAGAEHIVLAAVLMGQLDGDSVGMSEDAAGLQEGRLCRTNQRMIEGAAQQYLASDYGNASLADLDGMSWERLLVPAYIQTLPRCPTYGGSYLLRAGVVQCADGSHPHYLGQP